jgi:adenylate cyclase
VTHAPGLRYSAAMTTMTPEEEWRALLSGTHPHLQHQPFRFFPSAPRCKLCAAPFRGVGGAVFRRYGYTPWEKNPNICGRCFKGMTQHVQGCPSADEDGRVAGAEVDVSMVFADVRGSSDLARRVGTREFTNLMQRFYTTSRGVLVDGDAIVEKFIGDEVAGLFLPFMTGPNHARRAIDVAQELLRAIGHGSTDGPWVPLGVGVHTGVAFVGMVASGGVSDFTALGDPVNITAHLASQAAAGEILVSEEAMAAAGLAEPTSERRHVSLKGHPLDVIALRPQASFTAT